MKTKIQLHGPLALALTLAGPLGAAPILGIQSTVCTSLSPYPGSCPVQDRQENTSAPFSLNLQGTTVDSAIGGIIAYDMHGTASYGTLKSYFSVSLADLPNGALPWIFSEVWFEDEITLNSPEERGQGMVQFALSIDGTGSAEVSQPAILSSLLVEPFIARPQLEVATDYSANGPFDVTFLGAPMAFTWGVPFDVLMGFATEADFSNPYPPPCPRRSGDVVRGCPAYSVSAVMDFSDTATLSAINVFDAGGNSVRDFSVGSEAGASYATAPEASTSLCVGIGLVILSVGVGRMRRNLPQEF